MKQGEWLKVKEIFHQANALPVKDRPAFLDKACAGDTVIRTRVDELLSSYESGFMENDVLHRIVDIVGGESNFKEGQTIGRYSIKKLIGVGGMGDVFLADDTELNRPVAFKVLHEEVAADKERVRRFIQEARAASALNHPNILTIHEIGTFEGARFIVSEYVDGETLRERMRSGLTSAESLDIMCQIAAALQAAHAAGIVHRDIKPENIMLRQDGLVKVLDFGLAKLTEADDLPIDPTARPVARMHTSPGLVMGTAAYMSPEQARGQAVDSRTDLWSLGVVFHEMLTGESPFKGESVTDLVTSILKHDTTSFDLKSISQELKPICTKALAKDKKARYQTAQDLLQDLQGEKKRMEYAIQPTPFITASSTDELKTQLIRRRPTLSAEYMVAGMKRHKYATLTAIVLIVSGIGLSVYKYNGATPPGFQQDLSVIDSSTTESDLKISNLPISGPIYDIVISPDGKYVAYLDQPAKGVKLLQLETLAQTVIVPKPPTGEFWCLSFSPDSKFVYYLHQTYSAKTDLWPSQVMRVPVEGGTPMPVADNADNGVSFSPDGSTMVFIRDPRDGLLRADIVLTNPDGSNERILTRTTQIGNIPLFSPDGKTLALQMAHKDGSGIQIMGISVADGKQQTLRDKKWRGASAAVWLPNGNLVIAARENRSDPMQIWSIPPVGEPRALTSGFVSYDRLSATHSGDVMATIQVGESRDLWIIQENDARKARPVTTSGEIRGSSTWTPDGRIVTGSNVAGNLDLWMMNADGGGRKQLTNDPGAEFGPAISPDGKYIAFTSNRVKGVNHIFLMDIDGGNVKQLTNVDHAFLPSFSPDGKWIYFLAGSNGQFLNAIRKVSVNGGDAILVTTAPDGWRLGGIDINKADGRILYGLMTMANSETRRYPKVGVLPPTGEAKLIDLPANFSTERPRWAPDNRTIALMSVDTGDVWSMSVDGKGKPRQLTDFRTPGTADPRWTADGKQLLVSRGTSMRNPVLIRNSRN